MDDGREREASHWSQLGLCAKLQLDGGTSSPTVYAEVLRYWTQPMTYSGREMPLEEGGDVACVAEEGSLIQHVHGGTVNVQRCNWSGLHELFVHCPAQFVVSGQNSPSRLHFHWLSPGALAQTCSFGLTSPFSRSDIIDSASHVSIRILPAVVTISCTASCFWVCLPWGSSTSGNPEPPS